MEGASELKCGKPKQPRLPSSAALPVWEEETSLQLHTFLLGALPPTSDRVTLCPRHGTGPRKGLGASLPPWNAGWKGVKGEGAEAGEGGEVHPRTGEELGACLSRINAWPSEFDILPPQAARTRFLPCNEPPFPCTKTVLFFPSFLGPDGRKSLALDSKWPMSFPGMIDSIISPCRTQPLP